MPALPGWSARPPSVRVAFDSLPLVRNSSIMQQKVKDLFPDNLPPNARQTPFFSESLLQRRGTHALAARFVPQPRVQVVLGRVDSFLDRDRLQDQAGSDRIDRRWPDLFPLLLPIHWRLRRFDA